MKKLICCIYIFSSTLGFAQTVASLEDGSNKPVISTLSDDVSKKIDQFKDPGVNLDSIKNAFEALANNIRTTTQDRARYADSTKAILDLKKAKFVQKREEAITAAERTQKLMEATADLLNNTLSTAELYESVSQAMQILDSAEAVKVNNVSIRLQKGLNTTGDLLGGLGGAASAATLLYFNTKGQTKEGITPSVVTVSVSGIASLLLKVFGNKQRAKNVLNYAHDKATQLSIHAFLILRVKSVSQAIKRTEKMSKEIIYDLKGSDALKNISKGSLDVTALEHKDPVNPRNHWEQIEVLKKESDKVLSLIAQVDNLYNIELENLQKEVQERLAFKIYHANGITALTNLVNAIDNAKGSWRNVRYIYTKAENTLTKFRDNADELYEAAKPKISEYTK